MVLYISPAPTTEATEILTPSIPWTIGSISALNLSALSASVLGNYFSTFKTRLPSTVEDARAATSSLYTVTGTDSNPFD